MKFLITAVATATALALGGCGDNAPFQAVCGDLVCDATESAASCAEDCGCGNGIVNAGESCDGAELGDATCESVVQRGGTLACNADCTFDVLGCDEYMCGNNVAEPGEDCDGTDLAGGTCESVGLSGGDLSCDPSCNYDAAACCNDLCEDAGTSVCAGDVVQACTLQPSGCNTVASTDCTVNDDVCDDSGGTATCICVDRCPAEGAEHCAGAVAETCTLQPDGCLAWVAGIDCEPAGQACAIGPQGATCVPIASGDTCLDPYPLSEGDNVVAWSAVNTDYMNTAPSCNTSAGTGPDLVLHYVAATDGVATFEMTKVAGARHNLVVSAGSCGTTIPEIACVSDTTSASQGGVFGVTAGTTYYFYVRDTSTGTAPLPNPLLLQIDEQACGEFTTSVTGLSPANGATAGSFTPELIVTTSYGMATDVGVITITGTLGTSATFDLSTAPSQVTFTDGNRAMHIAPSVPFLAGESVTVTWSGVVDQICGTPITLPPWTFAVLAPTCTPGTGGMLDGTFTRVATGISSLTENYVAPDASPTGYVYFGGSSDLYRMPKAGGIVEDVVALSGITTTPLGNSMGVVGSRVFVVDTSVTPTTPFVTRLTTNGGFTWNPLAYAVWPDTPGDDARGFFHDGGKIYFVTDELTTGVDTEIWSVPASAVALPAAATLEGSFAGEGDCDAISGDATYFYVTCSDSERVVRVHRTTFQVELLTTSFNLSTSNNAVHAHDFDADGSADALYVKTDNEEVYYLCDPAGTGPYWTDVLASFGSATTTSNLGLGFDPVAGVLWAIDDDTRELIRIE